MKLNVFWPQDRPPNGPRRSQDGSKRDLKAFIFHHYFYVLFWFILSSILSSSGGLFGPPNRSKTAAKIKHKTPYANMSPRDHSKRPSERPRASQDPPKRPQEYTQRPYEVASLLPVLCCSSRLNHIQFIIQLCIGSSQETIKNIQELSKTKYWSLRASKPPCL